jgi:hypothetical protein
LSDSKRLRLKIIACDVLTREISHCIANSPHVVDVEFTEKGAHQYSDYLRELIQKKIDACEEVETRYDAICLGYGLCGNSTLNLEARSYPLVIPRAHDCCTLFLGSKEKFKEHFGDHPSMGFSAAGYLERGNSYSHDGTFLDTASDPDEEYKKLVEQYGEENAKYVWETLHPNHGEGGDDSKVVFIEIPEFAHLGYCDTCRQQAESDGKEFVCLEGSIRLMEMMVNGQWNSDEFLTVQPGNKIGAVYDLDQVIKEIGNGNSESGNKE